MGRAVASVVARHLPPDWRPKLLAVIGAKASDENLRLLDKWALAEGGTASWNPLNTTYPLPNATNYNSTGVKNYKRPVEGICATALTLVNGYYNGILGELQSGALTAGEIVTKRSAEFKLWGTDPNHILALLAAKK